MRTGVKDPAAIEGVVQPNITDAENLTGADIPMEIQISIALPDTREPMVASVQDLWVGADWNEKETWDLVGIDFEGHEGMRRVLNPHRTPVRVSSTTEATQVALSRLRRNVRRRSRIQEETS